LSGFNTIFDHLVVDYVFGPPCMLPDLGDSVKRVTVNVCRLSAE